jgi:hypothetical protein
VVKKPSAASRCCSEVLLANKLTDASGSIRATTVRVVLVRLATRLESWTLFRNEGPFFFTLFREE